MPAYEARLGYSTEAPFTLNLAILPDIGAFALSVMIETIKQQNLQPFSAGLDVALDDSGSARKITVASFHIDVINDPTDGGWNLDEEIADDIIRQRGHTDRQLASYSALNALQNSGGCLNVYPNFFYGNPVLYLQKRYEIQTR
jgi:hypothetical protein